jgi:hypothetical protein
MKKLLATIGLVSMGIATNAQLSRGTQLIGGNISFSAGRNAAGSQTYGYLNAGLSPEYTFFFTDHWAWRPSLGINYFSNTHTADVILTDGTTMHTEGLTATLSASIGLGLRYVAPVTDKLYIQVTPGISLGLGSSFSKTDNGLLTLKTTGKMETVSANIGAGLLYSISSRLLLSVSIGGLGYSYSSLDPELGPDNNSHALNFSYNIINLGLYYVLGTPKS